MNNLSATNINRERLAKVAAESIARINPNQQNGNAGLTRLQKPSSKSNKIRM
jgi:hypothetical protein